MPLCFCGRAARGFGYQNPVRDPFDPPPRIACCSIECMNIAHKREGNMAIGLNMDEKKAIFDSSAKIGEYLERIGKTDLATMTEAEWLGFIGHAYICVTDEVRRTWEKDIPF